MATVDATASTGGFQGQTSQTWSHTVASGATALYVVCCFFASGTPTINSVSWNGSTTGWTRVAQSAITSSNDRCEIWRLGNPTSGTHSIVVTPSAAADGDFGSISILGGDTTSFEETTSSNTGTGTAAASTAPTVSVSPTGAGTGDIAIDGITTQDRGQSITIVTHTGRTQAFNDTTGSGEGGAGSDMTSPANPQTLDWVIHNTSLSAVNWAMASVIVKNAGGAAQDTPELDGKPFGLRGQMQQNQLLAA